MKFRTQATSNQFQREGTKGSRVLFFAQFSSLMPHAHLKDKNGMYEAPRRLRLPLLACNFLDPIRDPMESILYVDGPNHPETMERIENLIRTCERARCFPQGMHSLPPFPAGSNGGSPPCILSPERCYLDDDDIGFDNHGDTGVMVNGSLYVSAPVSIPPPHASAFYRHSAPVVNNGRSQGCVVESQWVVAAAHSSSHGSAEEEEELMEEGSLQQAACPGRPTRLPASTLHRSAGFAQDGDDDVLRDEHGRFVLADAPDPASESAPLRSQSVPLAVPPPPQPRAGHPSAGNPSAPVPVRLQGHATVSRCVSTPAVQARVSLSASAPSARGRTRSSTLNSLDASKVSPRVVRATATARLRTLTVMWRYMEERHLERKQGRPAISTPPSPSLESLTERVRSVKLRHTLGESQ